MDGDEVSARAYRVRSVGPAARVVLAAAAGAAVGLAVAIGSSSVLMEADVVGPWGTVYGILAFLAAFGITLATLARGLQRRLGILAVGISSGLLSAGAWFFIIGWAVPPTTLEGAWIWPLALISSVAAVAAVVRAFSRSS